MRRTLAVLLGLVLLIGAALLVTQTYLQSRAEQQVAAWTESLPPGMRFEYGEVDAGFLSIQPSIKDIRLVPLDGVPIEIEEARLYDYDRFNDPPHHLHVKVKGIRRTLTDDDYGYFATLRALGYGGQLRGNYEISYRYEADARQFDLRELRAEVEGIGTMSLSMELTNFDLEEAASYGASGLPRFELRRLSLSYSDASLVDRMIEAQAESQGVSEEEVVDAFAQQLQAYAASMGNPFYAEATRELIAFVRDPGVLTLTAAPSRAVPVMEIFSTAMVSAAELPKQLNISVKAEKAR